MRKQYRQGDILLIPVHSMPEKAEPVTTFHQIVIALGERTGHKHAMDALTATLYKLGRDMYIDAEEGATLLHEEHHAIRIEPGLYKVRQQRQYDEPPARNYGSTQTSAPSYAEWDPSMD